MAKENPTVSVIIPTYNRAHLISRAIKSVLNQTYQDFELIVVDDGSTDNTEEVIQNFKDKRIKYFRHKINRGGNMARNTGLKNSKGQYIAFLDSDDEWLPEKLEKQLKVFAESKDERLSFVYCGAIFISQKDNKEVKRLLPQERGYIFQDLLRANNIVGGGSSCLIKKEAFDNCGNFDECEELRKGGAQEYEMWIRMAQKYNFDFVNICLIKYFIHPNSVTVTSKLENKAKAYGYIINKFIEDYKKFPHIYAYKLRELGHFFCLGGNLKKGREYFLKAILNHNYKTIINFFISLFGKRFYLDFFNFLNIFYIFKLRFSKHLLANAIASSKASL